MNILMIIDRYIPIWGGAENQLRQLALHLRGENCTIRILTRRWTKSLNKSDIIDGTTVVRVGWPGNNIFSTISYVWGLAGYVIKNRKSIDVIHTHGAAALGIAGNILGSVIGKPNIAKIATAGRIPQLKKNMLGQWVLYFLKKSDAIVCLSSEIEEELKQIHVDSKKIKRIPNAVDTTRFHAANESIKKQWRLKRGWDENSVVIIFSGRIVHRKGLDVLIKAWPAVHSNCPGAKLLILGSGVHQADSNEELIHQLVKEKQLKEIYFEGEVKNLEDYLKMGDVFVFPSRKEGMPNALLEAMSSSLAVVATKIGGNEDLIEDKRTGLLFSVDDDQQLSHIIINLEKSSGKRHELGLNARQYVISAHSFEKITNEYVHLYKNCLSPHNRG